MKLTPTVLVISLAANVVFVALWSVRSAPERTTQAVPVAPTASAVVRTQQSDPSPAKQVSMPPLGSAEIRATDFVALAARLKAEGFTPEVVRHVVARIIAQHFGEIGYATIRPKYNPAEYWTSPVVFADARESAARRKLERDQEAMLREVFGSEFNQSEERNARLYHGISAASVEKMRKIFDDYRELEEQLRDHTGSREELSAKYALLEKEKRADLERAMTPEELHVYDLRNGAGAQRLRNHLGAFQPTEAEFLAMYPAFKAAATADAVRPTQPISRDVRQAQQAAFDAEVRRVLGPERFAEFEKSRRR